MPDTIANTNFVVTNDSHRAADAVVRQGCAREALAENINALLAAARPRLQRLACKHGVLDDAVDDVVQETLLEAWRHLDHLREPGSFDAWLNGICRNVCMRWTRTQQTKIAYPLSSFYIREDIDDETASMEDIADPLAFDPAEELSRQDMAVLLDRALGYLPGSTREVIELCYLAELPQREAALRLGMTIHALEERLYRARRQLRQLLHTELRSEAESLGLMIDKEDNPGWRKSSQWCQFCGKQRLLGVLESRADGLARLYMRCPSCSPIYGEMNYSGWMVELYGLRSFRPALKRVEAKMKPSMTQALIDGKYPCHNCGEQAKMHIAAPLEPYGTYSRPHPEHVLTLVCPACREYSSMWACGATTWFHPVPRAFLEQHPQCVIGPETMTEYAGQPAIRFCLIDGASSARLIIFAQYPALQVLATFRE